MNLYLQNLDAQSSQIYGEAPHYHIRVFCFDTVAAKALRSQRLQSALWFGDITLNTTLFILKTQPVSVVSMGEVEF